MKLKHKHLFWIPLFGGFFTLPGEAGCYDGKFYKNKWMFPLFLLWHTAWFLVILFIFSIFA